MSDDAKLQITNPERLERVLEKLCNTKMSGIIRVKSKRNLAIRCVFSFIDINEKQKSIGFTNISVAGLENLRNESSILVEVVGLPFKLTFTTKIEVTRETGIIVSFPKLLQSLERRDKQRYRVVDSLTPFLNLSLWQPDFDALDSPPVFSQFEKIGSWLPIADLSVAGASIMCRFPGVMNTIQQGMNDQNATIILPMGKVIETPVTIRWMRRQKKRTSSIGPVTYDYTFRFGVEFHDLHSESKNLIDQFLRKLCIAKAI